MNIIWSPEALEDLGAALDYLAERSAPAAETLLLGIVALIERLATEPHEGPEHVLGNGARVRGWPYPPFRLYYQRTADAFLVVRLYHQRREPITR